MKTMTLFQQIIARLQSETPAFFKKLRSFGLWLTGSAISARVALAALPDKLPSFVDGWLGYCIAAGTLLVAFSTLPTTNKELSDAITPKEAKKIETNNKL